MGVAGGSACGTCICCGVGPGGARGGAGDSVGGRCGVDGWCACVLRRAVPCSNHDRDIDVVFHSFVHSTQLS